jgi:hypothetical protein
MPETFLLVDYENVHALPLSRLPDDWLVRVFAGRNQNAVNMDTVKETQPLGKRLEWTTIQGDGRNNLDFHLAYYLGELVSKHPQAAFVILSKDKGFDSLVKHLLGRKIRCERKDSLDSVLKYDPADPSVVERACDILKRSPKSRPRRMKTLHAYLFTHFKRELTEEQLHPVVQNLLERRIISESGNALTYHLET